MLVLSREAGEQICVGDDVVVKILDVRGGKVRVGIDAPQHIDVDREEIREKKLASGTYRRAAVGSKPLAPADVASLIQDVSDLVFESNRLSVTAVQRFALRRFGVSLDLKVASQIADHVNDVGDEDEPSEEAA